MMDDEVVTEKYGLCTSCTVCQCMLLPYTPAAVLFDKVEFVVQQ